MAGNPATLLWHYYHLMTPPPTACGSSLLRNQKMKIILAAPRGFCAGVNMAIESLDLALEKYGAPVYVYHEIVHNKYVVESFRAKGAIFVDHISDVPVGSNLLFSAHGVSPEVREQAKARNLFAVDATCPLVTKVHSAAIKYAKAGYTIILIGHEGHDEVIGTMGEAPEAIILVESAEHAAVVEIPETDKLAYLTQTTLSVDDATRIINVLKSRFPQLDGPPKDDICYATQNRQEAVRMIADECDMTLVLGSQNSSNSQRLRELSEETNVPAKLIDGASDVDLSWFTGDETILVTAGASAPETVVQDVIELLVDEYDAKVEYRTVREESVHFQLPKELRPTSTT